MAGWGLKDVNRELRERKDSKPRVNYCGGCGEECTSLLCEDCRGTLEPSEVTSETHFEYIR